MRTFTDINANVGRDRASVPHMQPPNTPSDFTDPASDPNNIMAALGDIRSTLTDLNQHTRLPRDLAIRVQVVETQVAGLEAHVNANFNKLTSEMNKNFDRMRREFMDKLQKRIDSNDEVMSQQYPVAGGAYGGPRMTAPTRAHSVFHGLTGPK